MTNRSAVRKLSAAVAIGLAVCSWSVSKAVAQLPGGTLDPTTIPKYEQPLVIPPAMPKKSIGPVDYYEIAVRQFQQQILPTGFPKTTVWSYGSVDHPGTVAEGGTFNYPAFTIEAQFGTPVRVKWINDLKDPKTGNFLRHLLPVDQSLHWANPPQLCAGNTRTTDCRGFIPGPYQGPVPIVTHLHGGHNAQESDGYAEAWYLPAANNILGGVATEGSFYQFFKGIVEDKFPGVVWQPGTATFQYENDQRAGTFWYHDHTLGMTRLNVYAGPAGFYLLRGGPDDLAPGALPGGAHEIPIAIQDRSFNKDGSLFYPASRTFFDGFTGPFIPASDVPRIWNPEFFANTIVVNGRTWPFLNVEPRRYRFRFLNGCNSRFLILKVVTDPLAERPAVAALPIWQIGTEGGFLPAPVKLDQLLMGLAERADVIVDFSDLPVGTEIYLINEGPDEPFGGGTPGTNFAAANSATTGQVMKFVVVPRVSQDASTPPTELTLPELTPLGDASNTRQVSLNEASSTVPGFDGPIAALLGTLDDAGNPHPLGWGDEITESPALGATEIWGIYNFTEDAHPIHIHEVQFQVVNRQPFQGNARPPEVWETGFKDTVIAYPGEITRVKALFDLPGLYVWHCHIVEHEDNEMMRPYCVGPNCSSNSPIR